MADALSFSGRTMWRYIWILPLFSTLFGMLYCTTKDVYAYASLQFLASRYLMLLGALFFALNFQTRSGTTVNALK